MDKVRFGRALGKGTRAAARSLWEAADAAASPDPTSRQPPKTTTHAYATPPSSSAPPASSTPPSFSAPPASSPTPPRPKATRATTTRAARTAGKSMLAPVKKFSSVLWLEVTGTFFALIAVFLAQGVWRLRAAARAPFASPDAHKFYAYTLIFLLFAWFAASSFLRARRRSRRT